MRDHVCVCVVISYDLAMNLQDEFGLESWMEFFLPRNTAELIEMMAKQWFPKWVGQQEDHLISASKPRLSTNTSQQAPLRTPSGFLFLYDPPVRSLLGWNMGHPKKL